MLAPERSWCDLLGDQETPATPAREVDFMSPRKPSWTEIPLASARSKPASRLLLPGLLISGVEVPVVAGALLLFGLDELLSPALLAVAGSTYVVLTGVWMLAQLFWLRPAARALRAQSPSPVSIQKAARCLARHPGLIVASRCAIWAAIAALGTLLASRIHETPASTILAAASVTMISVFGMSAFWWLWTERTTDEIRARLASKAGPDHRPEPPEATPRIVRERLVWSSLGCSAVGVGCLALFTIYFVAPEPRSLLLLTGYFPITIAIGVAGWVSLTRRLFRPVRRYLEANPESRRERATVAFRTAQALPYLLGLGQGAFWMGGGILVCLQSVWLFGLDPESAGLIFAATAVTSLAVTLYQALWHRRVLHPLLRLLGERHSEILARIRSPISVRVKMLGGFGILTLFACGMAVYWSFIQYRNLANRFIEEQAHTQVGFLVERLKTLEKIQQSLRPQTIAGLLREQAAGSDGVYYYLSLSGKTRRFSSSAEKAPPLPFHARTKMRRQKRGVLELTEHNLAGAYARIRLQSGDYGAVAVMFPDYLGRGPGIARQIKVLAFFFVFLVVLSGGIVFLMVDDLTTPLKGLERRVDEMAGGDLHRPVPAGFEVDEVGRLALAFEGMRKSLDEKLSTIQALNLGLEKKVEERTADLAKANEELREALDTLTRTKDQLVRSEKLASIGQLVAGIAHELNNPINAVINCVRPLERAAAELLDGLDPESSGAETAREAAADIQQILRVIASGTDRTKRIVSALGSYSRIDAEDSSRTDVNGALDDALHITAHLTAGHSVERSLGDDVVIRGWRGQLEQVFVNLIANAAQAFDKKRRGTICITTSRRDDEVVVEVADDGPGIPADVLPRIFDPFFTTKEVGRGTGLGLAISHDIISRHGGRIEVESEPGEGTTFTVVFPADSGSESASEPR
jgi:signal transduction histidine kinase